MIKTHGDVVAKGGRELGDALLNLRGIVIDFRLIYLCDPDV